MTPFELAQIHANAFTQDRSWTEAEFAALLASPHTALHTITGGFALTRTIARESELLMMAVDPTHQRRGMATSLMNAWLLSIATTADQAFLEVAEDNAPARALYGRFDFATVGSRSAYYRRVNAPSVTALVMSRPIPGTN